jgi:hypothetical protein
MNGQNPTPAATAAPSNPPPVIPPGFSGQNPGNLPLGDNPAERGPISGVFAVVEALLRQPRRVMYQLKQPQAGALITSLLIIAVMSALVYGVVAGTFSGGTQIWAAPVKIVIGLLISALICLPSLYIFSCLGGSHARLVEVWGLVAGLLALMTVMLIGFAPVAWVFSQATKSLVAMGVIHLVFWAVATLFGMRFLNAGFQHFSGGAGSGLGLKIWMVIFIMVALQMSTALRPILGKADTFLPAAADKKFFGKHWSDCVTDESDKAPAGIGR